ncbi:unnamed protein product, partial [marine sediment metagenome]
RRQLKKGNFDVSIMLAYRLENWLQIQHDKQAIFQQPNVPQHRPIDANEIIQPDDKLIIMIVPARLAAKVYVEVWDPKTGRHH